MHHRNAVQAFHRRVAVRVGTSTVYVCAKPRTHDVCKPHSI
jgi:hypothetical protein